MARACRALTLPVCFCRSEKRWQFHAAFGDNAGVSGRADLSLLHLCCAVLQVSRSRIWWQVSTRSQPQTSSLCIGRHARNWCTSRLAPNGCSGRTTTKNISSWNNSVVAWRIPLKACLMLSRTKPCWSKPSIKKASTWVGFLVLVIIAFTITSQPHFARCLGINIKYGLFGPTPEHASDALTISVC